MTSPLTERERWLMLQAYDEGIEDGCRIGYGCVGRGIDVWLKESASYGVTVDTVLAKDAPPPTPCPHIVSSDEGTSYCGLNGPGLVWSDEPRIPGWYLRRGAPQDVSRWLSDFTDRLPSPSDRFGQYAGPLDMPQEPSE